MAYREVDKRMVATAFRDTGKKKSLGPNGIRPLAISCVHHGVESEGITDVPNLFQSQ